MLLSWGLEYSGSRLGTSLGLGVTQGTSCCEGPPCVAVRRIEGDEVDVCTSTSSVRGQSVSVCVYVPQVWGVPTHQEYASVPTRYSELDLGCAIRFQTLGPNLRHEETSIGFETCLQLKTPSPSVLSRPEKHGDLFQTQ